MTLVNTRTPEKQCLLLLNLDNGVPGGANLLESNLKAIDNFKVRSGILAVVDTEERVVTEKSF